jgi:hypothetical protein
MPLVYSIRQFIFRREHTMSIYRRDAQTPFSDVYATAIPAAKKSTESADSAQQPPPSTPAFIDPAILAMRKSMGSEVLQRFTIQWAETLPPKMQPRALLREYPRVANMIALLWTEPMRTGFDNYMESLLVDHRGTRRGFPPHVASELITLRDAFDNRRRFR